MEIETFRNAVIIMNEIGWSGAGVLPQINHPEIYHAIRKHKIRQRKARKAIRLISHARMEGGGCVVDAIRRAAHTGNTAGLYLHTSAFLARWAIRRNAHALVGRMHARGVNPHNARGWRKRRRLEI